jgi:hypothetical protein
MSRVTYSELRALTAWPPLQVIIDYVRPDSVFRHGRPDNPYRELVRLLLRSLELAVAPVPVRTNILGFAVPEPASLFEWGGAVIGEPEEWAPFERNLMRWAKLCAVLDRSEPWDTARRKASEELAAQVGVQHPVFGEAGTIELAYNQIQKVLPDAARRPKKRRGPNRL